MCNLISVQYKDDNHRCPIERQLPFRQGWDFQINWWEGPGHLAPWFVVSYLVGLGFSGASSREETSVENQNCSILCDVLLAEALGEHFWQRPKKLFYTVFLSPQEWRTWLSVVLCNERLLARGVSFLYIETVLVLVQ